MRFTDYYAEASCTAGRANFITGELPIRTGLTTGGQAGSPLGVPAQASTIATALKAMGYVTGKFGKNHLGYRNAFVPCLHGFDEFFGYLYHLNAMEDPFWYTYFPRMEGDGGQDFVRVYSQSVYGVPPEQVVGSSILTKYEYRNGNPVLMREPKIFFIDDKTGKSIGINLFIGKRPYAAFGNSTGDQQMLEWTQAGDGARLMMLVLHDDPEREYAYGPAAGLPDSKVGTFSQALYDEAQSKGWTVISMKADWKHIFAFVK
jgi:hypothetical protein